MSIRKDLEKPGRAEFLIAMLVCIPLFAYGQTYPTKPVSVYIGFAAGATTDLSARALGQGLERVLGVPFVMESRPGATATVAAGAVARAKPDGYTLGVVSTGVITVRPHLMRLSYDPLKDFTLIAQYSHYVGALTVRSDSPHKTIGEFIAYAQSHPGLTYTSSGQYSQQQLATELFRLCKGLDFTHVPTKGGAEANMQLLGKHVDFTAGAGGHLQFVKEGRMRMLVLYNTDQRDPNFPEVPTMKEIGCQDAPALGYLVIAPKGLPDPIARILGDAIRKVADGPDFQKALQRMEIPYDYKDRRQLEKETETEFYFFKTFLEKMGVKPE
jgi:tripartite-type tricarboxylate transporter receptor subunit TctC